MFNIYNFDSKDLQSFLYKKNFPSIFYNLPEMLTK